MKILLGSFQCETNTFCGSRADIEDFAVNTGDYLIKKSVASKIFLEAGATVKPLISAIALPSGMVKRKAFDYFKNIFIDLIKKDPDADGIYLYLHGSMYIEGMGSGEEGLVKAIREEIGSSVPIAVAQDFHANLSNGFISNVNVIQGFRTAPHTDQEDTERRAAKSLLKCILQGAAPRPRAFRIPFLGGDASVTQREPFQSITKMLSQLDQRDNIASCAFFNGQPWYDAPYAGNCAVVSAFDESGFEEAKALAKTFWDGRELLALDGAMYPDDAVEESLKHREGILFVTDSGDNTTAGAGGEGTFLLNKYLKRNPENVLICGIYDRENTCSLLERKIGDEFNITLCKGCHEKQKIEINIDAVLKKKGRVLRWAGDEAGKAVIVEHKGIDILLTDTRVAFTTPEHFRTMDIDPQDYRVIVLKMGYLFPKLSELSSEYIFALTPGSSTNDFRQLDFKHLKKKMYPIYKDITWEEILQSAKEEEMEAELE